MKIRNQYKVREMAGEHVVIVQGRCGADMTKIISLNSTSLFLWNELSGRDFSVEDVAGLLTSSYDVDAETAARDAGAWVEKLRSCNLVEE
ncbi:MAG: PqqD family protein [Alistipes sp.]|nr:PqqD family protein [Alistipes sp.]